MKIAHLLLISLILIFQPLSGYAQNKTGPVPGRYIVKLKPGIKTDGIKKSLSASQSINQLFKANSLKSNSRAMQDYYIFSTVDTSASIDQIIATIGTDNIESIEPDYYLEFFDYPTDPYFSDQWYLHNEGQEYLGILRLPDNNNDELILKSGTPGKDVRLENYYATSPVPYKQIIVAILDSGVDLVHPDLEGQLWVNSDEIPDNGIDDDHNGYVDDIHGYDISGDIFNVLEPVPDNDPTDDHGHGTHIAGIVAAKRNDIGVVGVAPDSKIMAIKIRPNGIASISAEGIVYAVNSGANLINISFGSPYESGVMRTALEYARDNNVLVCIAAGNSGDTTVYYPAGFDSTFVVAASNSDGYLTYFTTYGSQIDVAAPGEDILSLRAAGTDLYGDVEPGVRIIGDDSLLILSDGTSMATPVVVGAAALLWAYHPELTYDQVQELLMLGADDLIDPFNSGDTLIGPDSISGYGTINIDQSFALIDIGGVFLNFPENRVRYSGAFDIKATPMGSYSSYWKLEYSTDNLNWNLLSEGSSFPVDSILYNFDRPDLNGEITFRLTDINNYENYTTIIYVNSDLIEITAPAQNASLKYNVDLTGSAFGINYDSLVIEYVNGSSPIRIAGMTGEFFDELIYNWQLSGISAGIYKVIVTGYFGEGTMADTVQVNIESSFAAGWPVRLGTYGSLSPITTDLNHDGQKEIAIGCVKGLLLFHPDGSLVDGFPVMRDSDMRTIPIAYNIDNDTDDELIITNANGVYAFNYDGSLVDGWPVETITGSRTLGFGAPYPTIGKLGMTEDSALVFVNALSQISAFEFNSDSYFYSLNGYFGSFLLRSSSGVGSSSSTAPQVTTADLNNDGLSEVIASYSSPSYHSGVGIFDGRTGQPAFGYDNPVRVEMQSVFGFALTDIDFDNEIDIVACGLDTNFTPMVTVFDYNGNAKPGWPKFLPDVDRWLANFITLADLDLDGSFEILCTFFEFEIGYLYIFKSDGTPYNQLVGYPEGVAFATTTTMGVPAVANLTGDEFPEIVFRGGHILPGVGSEDIFILDYTAQPIQGWPTATPARWFDVVSTRFAPLIDDIDNDNKVELIIVSDNTDLLVWDFEGDYNSGQNQSRLFGDNLNTSTYEIPQASPVSREIKSISPQKINLEPISYNSKSGSAMIAFELPEDGMVTVDLYSLDGKRVATLQRGQMEAGRHIINFDQTDLNDGSYYCRLKTNSQILTRKLELSR